MVFSTPRNKKALGVEKRCFFPPGGRFPLFDWRKCTCFKSGWYHHVLLNLKLCLCVNVSMEGTFFSPLFSCFVCFAMFPRFLFFDVLFLADFSHVSTDYVIAYVWFCCLFDLSANFLLVDDVLIGGVLVQFHFSIILPACRGLLR